ncbi:MAG: type II toxin-antitoxin system RelE/ParE family toxin [Chloroflexi bacterium]|nr:type II toxin-antitoxin system RelE/ParE family toxin [Chloroflexota bacterium]
MPGRNRVLSIGWSSRAIGDLTRIESYWLGQNPAILPSVLQAILARVTWIGDDHASIGSPVPELPTTYRSQLERAYGYKVSYRVNGDPPTSVTIITIRHAMQRPLSPSPIRRYS